MIIGLLVIILLLLLYVSVIAEKAKLQADAIVGLLTKQAVQADKETRRGLDYEWGQEEWPKWSDDAPKDSAWVPYKNPAPYARQDAYALALLEAETAASADAREAKRFLARAYQTLGAYLPQTVCDVAVGNPDAFVRTWAASHIALVRRDYSRLDRSTSEKYSEGLENAPVTRDYRALLQNDPDPLVRAAILSNPETNEPFVGWLGVAENWKQRFLALSQLERLALMRVPDLSASLALAIMKVSPSELGTLEAEYVEAMSVAVLNPNLVERSRRQGRDWYSVFGDASSPMDEFGEMWELAATTWLKSNPVPYCVFSFIQTKASIKLAIYQRLSGEENEVFREAIISGCEPGEDRELLSIGLEDSRRSIVEAAIERCGDYLPHVRKFKSKKVGATKAAAKNT
jgi:hypothetical protein